MALSPEELQAVSDLFERKQWKRTHDTHGEVFANMCAALGVLSADERSVVMRLTTDFLWCDVTRSGELAALLAIELEAHLANTKLDVYAVGLIKPSDFGKVKSAGFAQYLLLPQLRKIATRHGLNLQDLDRPDRLPVRAQRSEPAVIILVDDFVGSGGTASKVLDYLKSRTLIAGDVVIVASLVMQRAAVALLAGDVAACTSPVMRERGIADTLDAAERPNAYTQMNFIEKRLAVPAAYRFGYGRSESLVCMVRCPNNTFPFYWDSGLWSNEFRAVPFPR